jgi:hypothetical protein
VSTAAASAGAADSPRSRCSDSSFAGIQLFGCRPSVLGDDFEHLRFQIQLTFEEFEDWCPPASECEEGLMNTYGLAFNPPAVYGYLSAFESELEASYRDIGRLREALEALSPGGAAALALESGAGDSSPAAAAPPLVVEAPPAPSAAGRAAPPAAASPAAPSPQPPVAAPVAAAPAPAAVEPARGGSSDGGAVTTGTPAAAPAAAASPAAPAPPSPAPAAAALPAPAAVAPALGCWADAGSVLIYCTYPNTWSKRSISS